MSIPVFQVDAFTDRPFAGNPAAVCIMPGSRDDAWYQAVAAEMNLAENLRACRVPGDAVNVLRMSRERSQLLAGIAVPDDERTIPTRRDTATAA